MRFCRNYVSEILILFHKVLLVLRFYHALAADMKDVSIGALGTQETRLKVQNF